MEVSFETIGLEISNEQAFNSLIEDTKTLGEASHLVRKAGVLHGRCWRLGAGLEVWTILYESDTGEIFHADCRPAFRARFAAKISPWIMTEYDKSGEALIHGYVHDSETEILFALQNLTEANAINLQESTLSVGLCGLAQRATIVNKKSKLLWHTTETAGEPINHSENTWSLCGEVIDFEKLQNPHSGNDLFWIYLRLPKFQLEILVNQRMLKSEELQRGAKIKADVWLQGHIIGKPYFSRYEGLDYRYRTIDFWQKLKRSN